MTADASFNWLGLDGRVCAVTGAASGIGAAIAESFARAGAQVMLLDRNGAGCERVAKSLRTAAGRAVAMECDVSDPERVRAAADRTAASLGPCEILVNNAGFLRPGPLASLSLADWNAMLAVNLTGYFLCAQAFGRQMRDLKRGSVVHVASIAASHPQGFSGAYSVTKAAIAMLSKQLALEWGPFGIRSNVVNPGLIRTPLSEEFYQVAGVAERRAAIVPRRRIGLPADIADVVLFLASDRADYVNGAEVGADGGFGLALMSLIPRPGYDESS
jgi:glucose 1-dehydrogenase